MTFMPHGYLIIDTADGKVMYNSASVESYSFTGNGTTVDFQLTKAARGKAYLLVIVNGLIISPNNYELTINNTNLSFISAPSGNIDVRNIII